MPIKELIALATAALTAIAITGGPKNFSKNLRRIEMKMLRQATRTSK